MKIDGVEYKFKQGLKGNNDTNKRFVGYIAQQIESVVPQSVQLIDGILHVDYESLIPYLSESIKQNFKDINQLNSKTDHIHQVVDMMYNEFVKKERQNLTSTELRQSAKPAKRRWGWIIGTSISIVLLLSIALGVFIASMNSNIHPLTPLIPSTPSPSASEPMAPQGHTIDMMVLKDIYTAANGLNWGTTKWLTSAPVCEWEGVTCNQQGRIVKLTLQLSGMKGTLPDTIGQLDMLTDLVISYTGLSGTIPRTLANLTNLQYLNLDYNRFEGVIPSEIFSFPSLKLISISGNNNFLPWEIPSTIKSAQYLEDVSLDECNVIGTIPSELVALSKLRYLSMESNHLVGTIPNLKGTSIESIHLWDNEFSGSIPQLPSSLIFLDLSSNNLTGDLANINQLSNLTVLSLYMNSLSGEFWLNDRLMNSIQKLNIANNQFTSVDPSIANATALLSNKCDVSDNDFKCPVPSWMIDNCSGDCV